MPGMRGDHSHHVTVEFGQMDAAEIFIHVSGKGAWISFIPCASNWGGTKVKGGHEFIVAFLDLTKKRPDYTSSLFCKHNFSATVCDRW
jgi:hypothetical protein